MHVLSDIITTGRSLTATVNHIAARFGSPAFTPHVTVVGTIEGSTDDVMEMVRSVASHTAPLDITLEGVERGATFYQSVFARVHKSAEVGYGVCAIHM